MRRCIECDRRLLSREQGALCSDCYFGLICDPANAVMLAGPWVEPIEERPLPPERRRSPFPR